jgi:hypothetical protein
VPESGPTQRPPAHEGLDAAKPLTNDVVDLVNAVLGVGVSILRTVAQATTSERLPPGDTPTPLGEMDRLTTTAAGNVISSVVHRDWPASAATTSARRTTASDSDRGRASGNPGVPQPRVTAGSTLRIPLLVENSTLTSTGEVGFVVRSIERTDSRAAEAPIQWALPAEIISFDPVSMEIGPRDFEKLTVRVATTPDIPAGQYRAVIVGRDGWFSTHVSFEIITPASP